ncbi:hypothetical protein N9170_01405, partial [Akkermansiaceae bacterium]|nr:hypothetical protein [Akkermansiaceae bacterium]
GRHNPGSDHPNHHQTESETNSPAHDIALADEIISQGLIENQTGIKAVDHQLQKALFHLRRHHLPSTKKNPYPGDEIDRQDRLQDLQKIHFSGVRDLESKFKLGE